MLYPDWRAPHQFDVPAPPSSLPRCGRSAMLHVISLAQYAIVHTRSWGADSSNARMRLKSQKEQVEHDAALLRAEIRI